MERTQRGMARAVMGIEAQTPPAGTLMETNLVPTSVITKTQVASLTERWRRLPPSHLRHTIINQPQPPTANRP